MKGDKWSRFSTFLNKIQKPKFKSECLFIISNKWFKLKGFYSSFLPMKWLHQESCLLLEVNEIFCSETRQASTLYPTVLRECSEKGTNIICLLVNYSYYFLLFHVCTEIIWKSWTRLEPMNEFHTGRKMCNYSLFPQKAGTVIPKESGRGVEQITSYNAKELKQKPKTGLKLRQYFKIHIFTFNFLVCFVQFF